MIESAAREEADRNAAAAFELRMTNSLDGATLSPAARDLLLDELARLLTLQTDSGAAWEVNNHDLGSLCELSQEIARRSHRATAR